MAGRTKTHWIQGAVLPEAERPKKREYQPRKSKPCGSCGQIVRPAEIVPLRHFVVLIGDKCKFIKDAFVPLCRKCAKHWGLLK